MREEKSRSWSLRVFQTAVLVLVVNGCAAQELTGPRYQISEADIANKLTAIGIGVNPSQVHLAAHIGASVQSPKLEISAVEPTGDDRVDLELHCSAAAECLPFFAAVNVQNVNSFVAEVQAKRPTPTPKDHQATSSIGASTASSARLKVGSQVLLIVRDGHMEIHLQVLTIDSGAIGQQVRVCTLDRKKVFRGTVTNETTVSGEME